MFFFLGPRPFCINKEKEKPTTQKKAEKKSEENNDFLSTQFANYTFYRRGENHFFNSIQIDR